MKNNFILTSTEEPFILLNQVCRVFGEGAGQVEALKSVSFKVYPGEEVAIIGPSGSGKSTLLNILGTLDSNFTGQYLLNGQDIGSLTKKQLDAVRSEVLGFVFQDFQLLPYLNLYDNALLGLTYRKNIKKANLSVVDHLLKIVGLEHRKYANVRTLSGGEKQRLAIVRSLVSFPKLLLADEPTGNLDQKTSQMIMGLLKQLRQDFGYTLIVVTHDPKIAAHCPRKLKVVDGVLTDVSFSGFPENDSLFDYEVAAGELEKTIATANLLDSKIS